MWLAALMAVTFVGVFSKESAVVILGVIVLYELVWWKERKNLAGVAARMRGGGPAASGNVVRGVRLSWLARGSPQIPFVDNPLVAADFWTARLTAMKVLARYLGLLVWPASFRRTIPTPRFRWRMAPLSDWIAWIALAAVVAAVIYIPAQSSNRVCCGLCGALTFLPTANLLFPIGTIMAERFLYLPAIAAAVCIVMALYALSLDAQGARRWCCVRSAARFAIRTWVRNTDWQDDLSLARAMVRAHRPRVTRDTSLLAAALYDSHADIDSVIAEAEKGLAPLEHLPVLQSYAPPIPAGRAATT